MLRKLDDTLRKLDDTKFNTKVKKNRTIALESLIYTILDSNTNYYYHYSDRSANPKGSNCLIEKEAVTDFGSTARKLKRPSQVPQTFKSFKV